MTIPSDDLLALRNHNAEKAEALVETGVFNNPMAATALDLQSLKIRLDCLTDFLSRHVDAFFEEFELEYEREMAEFLAEQLAAMNRVRLLS